jgi:hypothetical protein
MMEDAQKIHWYHFDDARLFSFSSWLPAEEAETLSRQGFVYMGTNRLVFCCACMKQHDVSDASRARHDHEMQEKSCYLLRLSVVTKDGRKTLTTGIRKGADKRMLTMIDEQLQFLSGPARLATYNTMDIDLARTLADNGFASKLIGLESECTYCKFRVSNFAIGHDDVARLHAENSPHCVFVEQKEPDTVDLK